MMVADADSAVLDLSLPTLTSADLGELMGFPVHFFTHSPECVHFTCRKPLEASFDGERWVVKAWAEGATNG